MSYLHVQRLESVRHEYMAATAAVAYLSRTWHELGDAPEISSVRLSHVRAAKGNLEATYIIRIFSEFEAILHDYLTARHPGLRVPYTAEALINRVALRERVPDPIRDAAQTVREYRNALVHHRITTLTTLTFRQVMARLNQYLVLLP